ncbi:MAG: S8 family serine peptidase [Chloroflexi bacterium]|nr:S8 family serine peptidase [Chloroflexota bacterium]
MFAIKHLPITRLLAVTMLILLMSAQLAAQDSPALAAIDLGNPPAGKGASPEFPALSDELADLLQTWRRDPAAGALQAQAAGLEVTDERLRVLFIFFDAAAAEAAEPRIEAEGGVLGARFDRWLEADVPPLALQTLVFLPELSFIRRPIPLYPADGSVEEPEQDGGIVPLAGSFLTEGVAASNADDWHARGFDGTGLIVAVLDSFKDYTTAQSLGELPTGARLTTLGTIGTGSRHGTACAEIVFDMAPGADLILVTPGTATEMASRIRELADRAASTRPDVITSSLTYYNDDPGDGSGQVSQAINYAMGKGVLNTQSGGNRRLTNYQANFNDPDSDGWHEFTTGDEIDFFSGGADLPANVGLHTALRWNRWPTTNQDYDLYIYKCSGGTCTQFASSRNWQTGTQPPTEEVYATTDGTAQYGFAIHRYSATETVVLDVMGHNAPNYENNMFERSLNDPASGLSVMGIAALFRSAPYALESYSSEGPSMGSGGSLGTGLNQPRLAGYAVVDTWSYGNDSFNGTSAATPHVAGAAAAVWEAYPSYTAAQIQGFLESRAVDMGAAGYDTVYGRGRLYLSTPPPLNDASAGAYVASNPPYSRTQNDVWNATQINDPTVCGSNHMVWYRYTFASGSPRPLVVDTEGSSYDTVLGVYTSPNPVTPALIVCDDDSGTGTTSRVEFTASAGVIYYIGVASYYALNGEVSLTLNVNQAPPANDQWAGAYTVGGLPYTMSQAYIRYATMTGDPTTCASQDVVWYRYWSNSGQPRQIIVDTEGSTYDTVLGVYTSPGAPTPTLIACDDDSGAGTTSRVEFTASVGTFYYIAVGAYSALASDQTLTLNVYQGPPLNDGSGGAVVIPSLPYGVTQEYIRFATMTGDPTLNSPLNANMVWYRYSFASGLSHRVVVDTLGSDYDTVLGVYTTPDPLYPVIVAMNDDYGGVQTSRVEFNAHAGIVYYIGVAAYNALASDATLVLHAAVTPTATINGTVTIQHHVLGTTMVRVRVVPPSHGSAVFDEMVAVDSSGAFAIGAITPGTYHIWVKHNNTLSSSVANANLVLGSNAIAVPQLRGGDANNDNFVNIQDFSMLAATFGTTNVDAPADFSGDGVVNITDFSILASNFGQAGSTLGAP